MSEYINRYEALVKLEDAFRTRFIAKDLDEIKGVVKNIPSADVIEVVRCRECKRCECLYPNKEIGKEAKPEYYCRFGKCSVKPNDFCSYGEKCRIKRYSLKEMG